MEKNNLGRLAQLRFKATKWLIENTGPQVSEQPEVTMDYLKKEGQTIREELSQSGLPTTLVDFSMKRAGNL